MFQYTKNILVSYFSGLDRDLFILNFIQLFVIILILLLMYKKIIKGTQAEKLVRGIFVLIFAWLFSEILIKFNLQIWGVFLKMLISVIAISLIVIFQPELRRFLGYLGQSHFLYKLLASKNSVHNLKINVPKELVESAKYLSRSKTGALIVLEKDEDYSNYSEVGVKLDALLSNELLLTIFHPNTPLHDGAVVIRGEKIISAGVLLPLTEDPKLSWKYGTRHRAAIGMTELTNCACLVVSEETGDISLAIEGTLKKYDDLSELKADLNLILNYNEDVVDKNKEFFYNAKQKIFSFIINKNLKDKRK